MIIRIVVFAFLALQCMIGIYSIIQKMIFDASWDAFNRGYAAGEKDGYDCAEGGGEL